MILIGSAALRLQLINRGNLWAKRLESKDFDFVMTMAEFERMAKGKQIASSYPFQGGKKFFYQEKSSDDQLTKPYEIEIAWPDSTAACLTRLVLQDHQTIQVKHPAGLLFVAGMDMLYTLKMTHRYRKDSPHFQKTMTGIRQLRELDAVIRPEFEEFFAEREKETYAYQHPKLNVSKSEFFKGDGVNYVYDHDSIHEAVKHLPQPAYKFFQPEHQEVQTSRQMFEILPLMVKLYSVLEEAYVLALERSQIPHGRNITPRKSFEIALEKVCTSITSGWWREFAWENYNLVDEMYSDNYVTRFNKAESMGMVKPYKG